MVNSVRHKNQDLYSENYKILIFVVQLLNHVQIFVTPMEYSGSISFRIDWFDLLAVQGTLKSLLQHHTSKVSMLLQSAFFMVQLSHPYMTTGKTIALTRQSFIGKIMSLLFNILSRFVTAFLARSKSVLISWLESPSAVILEPKKIGLSLFPLFSHLFAMK